MLRYHMRNRRVPVAVGTISYIQDWRDPYGVMPERLKRRNPWIVLAWHPREYTAARRGPDGKYQSTYMRGGHMAGVKSLRTGEERRVADWMLQASEET